MLLVAPTEHALHSILPSVATTWKISSLPEKHGCDLLVPTKSGVVGFQRKTLSDLLASRNDGRLYYELNQLSESATVSHAFLIIESTFATTTDGSYYTEADVSVSVIRSIIAKFSSFNVGYLPTHSPRDTLECALSVSNYLSSGRANVIPRPKNLTNEWGQTTSRAYGIFLLQSFPGIGPKVAAAIYDHFGTVPITWTVSAAELAQVPGIGRRRAESLTAALAPVSRRNAETGT